VEHIEGILFDWDGTLIESLPLKIENASLLFAEIGADAEHVRSSYAHHSGVPRRELFDRIAVDTLGRPLNEEEFSRLSLTFSEKNRSTVRIRGSLKPNVLPVLRKLSVLGIPTFVSTASSPEEVTDLARHFGVESVVVEVMGSTDGFTKGEGHVRHVCDRYGLKRNHLIGVGDDLSDVKLFKAAGIASFGLVGTRTRAELTHAGADVIISSLNEVFDHVS
jgi:phosphoglycolate phosphatase-like HAD superfamily hydrolase